MRKGGAWMLVIGIALLVGSYVALENDRSRMRVDMFSGFGSGDPSPVPYIIGAFGGLAILVAIVMFVVPERQVPTVTAGWHDDPNSPDLLRYHDGSAWTERTASKGDSLAS